MSLTRPKYQAGPVNTFSRNLEGVAIRYRYRQKNLEACRTNDRAGCDPWRSGFCTGRPTRNILRKILARVATVGRHRLQSLVHQPSRLGQTATEIWQVENWMLQKH